MKNTKISAVISSLLLGAAIGGNAEAAIPGALASAVVTIDNFLVSKGGVTLNVADFNTLTFTSSSDVGTSLGGPLTGVSSSSSDGALIDLYSAKGVPGPADNSFPELSAGSGVIGPVGSNFAVADTFEYGSPIGGLAAPLFTDPAAFLGVASYVSLTGNGDGSAQSNNSLEAKFTFSLLVAGVLDFAFDANPYIETYLSSGAQGVAASNLSIFFSLEDAAGNSVLDNTTSPFIDPLLNFNFQGGRSSSAPGSGVSRIQFAGGSLPLGFSTLALDANKEYSLTARMNATADARFVPEPESLALFGIGLLGFAASMRNKSLV